MRRADGAQPRVLVLLGATASGKTAVGVEVARRIGGEIISADSRAVFAGLEVVTARPDRADRKGVAHHVIGTVEPCESYDAMAFRRDTQRLIEEIVRRQRVPMVVGGSTLYLEAILRGVFEGPSRDARFRQSLNAEPVAQLHRRLSAVDPAAAHAIHPNDRLRITRALEVFELSGRAISEWQRSIEPLPASFCVFGLRRDREEHRRAIAARVRTMLERGLIDEVSRLRDRGLASEMQAYRTIGIPEVLEYLDGRSALSEVEDAMIRHTWALARRQAAWFRRYPEVRWIDVTETRLDDAATRIVDQWRERHG